MQNHNLQLYVLTAGGNQINWELWEIWIKLLQELYLLFIDLLYTQGVPNENPREKYPEKPKTQSMLTERV